MLHMPCIRKPGGVSDDSVYSKGRPLLAENGDGKP